MVVLVLSLVFIFSVVALHSMLRGCLAPFPYFGRKWELLTSAVIAKITRRFSS